MQRLPAGLIALVPDEQGTLLGLAFAEQALDGTPGRLRGARIAAASAEAIVRVAEAAQAGVVDVGDPVIRGWLSARRDALLAGDAGDVDDDSLALIARLLSDAVDAAA